MKEWFWEIFGKNNHQISAFIVHNLLQFGQNPAAAGGM
jgi:hypothetical protein